MNHRLFLIALGAVALAACNAEPENIIAGEIPDPMAGELANAAPVVLPPAIAATRTYRCKDNSLVMIDWLVEAKGANFRADAAALPVPLTPVAEQADSFAADGYALTGTAAAPTITLAQPGKPAQNCKA